MEENLWGAIDSTKWQQTPCIKDIIATEQDVKDGRAVFYIIHDDADHEPLNINIPSLVYEIEEENNTRKLAVLIQGERVGENEYVGIRYFEGGNGLFRLSEIEFLEHGSNDIS